ncbi:uncharacterized protein J4E79_006684 [Alternaria viburni]|uniref:uncharacterized protein n=1 Tax=Alternaria viburni TaxID=566460 RepID=UPI0020C2D434|nr:uncharacterized protein J4E79_006684 [Alternaria viburni]KAI4658924.1 hypothetical protein J4E79_006684 [Alternaria viburni]
MAPTKKRASSPAKGIRSSKRLKVQTPKARPTISTIPTQDGCAFLNLPREIRNQVYMESLKGLDLTFRVNKLIIAATPNSEGYIRHPGLTKRGLPLWSLSSQQICYEVLDLIARNYTFQPYGRPRIAEIQMDEGVPNTLVFSEGGVGNIKLWPSFDRTARSTGVVGDQSVPFLKLMDSLSLKDAYLGIVWQYAHERGDPKDNDPTDLTEEWGKDWQGMFRKVKVNVMIRGLKKDTTPLWIMDEAEKFALRLVGTGGAVVWENPTDMVRVFWRFMSGWYKQKAWVGRLTVERKV